MLKEFKRKELEEKVAQLKAVTGADELNVDDIDLDRDFDPDEHDKKMQAIFNSEYYEVDGRDEKPEASSRLHSKRSMRRTRRVRLRQTSKTQMACAMSVCRCWRCGIWKLSLLFH